MHAIYKFFCFIVNQGTSFAPPLYWSFGFRASISFGMNPDGAKLKKRKFFVEDAEESTLPAAKHKCREAAIDLEEGLLFTTDAENGSSDMDVLDPQVDSAQDSNSFPADSQLFQLFPEVKFNTDSGKMDSYDEASTSWSNSASAKSLNSSFYSDSKILSVARDGKEDVRLTGDKYLPLGVECDGTDFLNECTSGEHFKDSKQQSTEGLEEFLSCSGMSPNLFMLSSEKWSVDQGNFICIDFGGFEVSYPLLAYVANCYCCVSLS